MSTLKKELKWHKVYCFQEKGLHLRIQLVLRKKDYRQPLIFDDVEVVTEGVEVRRRRMSFSKQKQGYQ